MGDDRMIRSGLINMIRENARKGKSAYAVGKGLGISKNTAKKYMHQPKTEHGLKGRTRPTKLDPFKPQINEMMENGIFTLHLTYQRKLSNKTSEYCENNLKMRKNAKTPLDNIVITVSKKVNMKRFGRVHKKAGRSPLSRYFISHRRWSFQRHR
jgi:hypothetical protein